jgi:murein DD-endopeptidase MepM/ murein hydrolase activator NlpD
MRSQSPDATLERRAPEPQRRRWTLILVPPQPGAAAHQVSVSARTVRAIGTAATIIVGGAFAWGAAGTASASKAEDRLAATRQVLMNLHDSVAVLRGRRAVDSIQTEAMTEPDMVLPVAGEITSRFTRSRFQPLLNIVRPHEGVDVSAPLGTPIYAPAAGVVSFVGWRFGDGLTVELAHSGKVLTRFAHCRKALVRDGQPVAAGQQIAEVGASGLATGPHLHFEVVVDGTPVDPLQYIAQEHDTSIYAASRVRVGDH